MFTYYFVFNVRQCLKALNIKTALKCSTLGLKHHLQVELSDMLHTYITYFLSVTEVMRPCPADIRA